MMREGSMLQLVLTTFQLLYSMSNGGYGARGNAIWLENVHCDTYVDYVETDSVNARYLPFVVKLHRCQGSVGVDKPADKACVPSNVTHVEIVTQNLQTFRYETIKVVNHTKCTSRCTQNASICNPYQKWNVKRCRCDCKTPHGKDAACCAEKMWSATQCNCVCRRQPHDCARKRQEWSARTCGCQCKPKYHQRCAQLNLTLDVDTCRCFNNQNLMSNNQEGSVCYRDTVTLSLDIVVLLCVAEALLIVFIYVVYYIGCRAGSANRPGGAGGASANGGGPGTESSNLLLKQHTNGNGEPLEELHSQSTVFGGHTS